MTSSTPVPADLIDFIKNGKKFLIAGHKEPDGDCVGSQLALTSVLKRLGKKAIPCSAGPFKRTEIMPYADQFTAAPGKEESAGGRVIIVDCSEPERTGDLAPFIKDLPTAVIDHHIRGGYADGKTENSGPVYLDPKAPSVTFMVLKLIEALGEQVSREEAEYLLFGLCTDTGFLRHVDSLGAKTFAAAERLTRAGANPKTVFHAIHGGKSLGSRILLGLLLTRTESHYGGKLLYTWEEYEDTQRFGLEGRDSDQLYQLLLSVGGTEAVVVIRQETPENCTVGLRSRDWVDVAAVASLFGGGGHKNAAGMTSKGNIAELKKPLLEAFEDIFPAALDRPQTPPA